MTRTFRVLSAVGILTAVFLAAAAQQSPARAALPYTVSATATEPTVAVGGTAIFRLKVEGQTAALPSFSYDVDGGVLAAVTSLDPTAANVAEGAVFVTRDDEGTARLTVRFGSEVLATGQARFAKMGKVTVDLTVDAGPSAAARTWRYEVLTPGGQVVATLDTNTSGDSPTSKVSTASLPHGVYTVRQVLGSDTRTSCSGEAFYEAANPERTVDLNGNEATAPFVIRPCPALPADLGVLIPVDTIVPPGETPISEVRGARDEGPGAAPSAAATPLPPQTGNSSAAGSSAAGTQLILIAAALAMLLPGTGLVAVTVRRSTRR